MCASAVGGRLPFSDNIVESVCSLWLRRFEFFSPLNPRVEKSADCEWMDHGCLFPSQSSDDEACFFFTFGACKKKVSQTSVQVRLWGTDVILLWHQPARADARTGSSEPNPSSGVWSCKMGNIFQKANGRMSATCVCRYRTGDRCRKTETTKSRNARLSPILQYSRSDMDPS